MQATDPSLSRSARGDPGSRRWVAVGVLLLLTGVYLAYRTALSRYFCSEDLPLLGSVAGVSPWEVLQRDLTSSWLGTTFVRFYRPVSTFVLALEVKVLGLDAGALHRVQLAWHLLNVLLVFVLTRRMFARLDFRMPALTALCVAAGFGTWPLLPNAVSFVASISTLLHATCFLIAVDGWLRFQDGGGRAWLGVSLVAFLVGLGAYEGAVVLPLALGAWTLFQPAPATGPSRCDRLVRAGLLFGVPLLGYFVLRQVLLGDWIGGYGSGLLGDKSRGGGVLGDPLHSLALLLRPQFLRTSVESTDLLFCLAGYALPLFLFLVCAVSGRRALAGTGLFALCWILICAAPYVSQPLIPSTGRYWYLACLGPLWAVMLAAGALVGRGRAAPALHCLLGAGLLWQNLPLLAEQVDLYREAGDISGRIHEQMEEVAGEVSAGTPVFVGNVPTFVRDAEHLPVAPVYWYGLRDSANPPFSARPLNVYPLPLLRQGVPPSLAVSDPEVLVYGWHPVKKELERKDAAATLERLETLGSRLEVLEPVDGRVLAPDEESVVVRFRGVLAQTLRLVVVTPASARVQRLELDPDQEYQSVELSASALVYHRRFYPEEPIYWWLEAKDAQGNLVGYSERRTLRVSDRR